MLKQTPSVMTSGSASEEDMIQTLSPLLQAHGSSCISQLTLQPGLDYFLVPSLGYVAYRQLRHWLLAPFGRRLVVGDPVTAPSSQGELIRMFLAAGPPTIFLQVHGNYSSRAVPGIRHNGCVEILTELGFEVSAYGYETEFDLAAFDLGLSGGNFAPLRRLRNKAQREGVEVLEKCIRDVPARDVERISANWLKRKGGREFTLLTRPLLPHIQGTRYFWGTQKGKLVCAVVFDPIYWEGEIIGYYQDFVRYTDDAPHGTSDLVTLEAFSVFRAEGIRLVSMGLSPLSEDEVARGDGPGMVGKLRFIRKHFGFLYPFEGNIFYKKRYHGSHTYGYVAAEKGASVREILVAMKAMNTF